MRKSFAVVALSVAVVVVASAQPRPKVGAILPMSGPFALEAERATAVLNAELVQKPPRIEVVFLDSAAKPDTAVNDARQLIFRDKVDLIIGPVLRAEALAVATYPDIVDTKIPILLLVALRGELLDPATTKNPNFAAFSGVPDAQLAVLRNHLARARITEVGVIGASADGSEVVRRLGANLKQTFSLPVEPDLVQAYRDVGAARRSDFVVGAGPEMALRRLAAELDRAGTVPYVMFAPPPLEVRARIAATLVRAALAKGSPGTLMNTVRSSPLYDPARKALSLDWMVLKSRHALLGSLGPVQSGQGNRTSCSCCPSSTSGCTEWTCGPGEKCKVDDSSTCTGCGCQSS